MASLRKSERPISSRGYGCFTISPPQLPAAATRFPSHGSGRPGLELRTATKLSSAGFEPTAILTFGLRVRRLNHSATRSLSTFLSGGVRLYKLKMKGVLFLSLLNGLQIQWSKTLISQLKLILLSSNCLINLISGCRVRIRSLILERMFVLFYCRN